MDYVRPLTSMLDICLTLEPNFYTFEDLTFLESGEFAFLLGASFHTNDVDAIKAFSRSLLWFTYRRNWSAPIGGFGGPTSDRGWGCMIRCGQMLLAQCLSLIHLGPNWRWHGQNSLNAETGLLQSYKRLLRMFQDKRTAQYSIHQIAQMGVSEGKDLGDWLGPNTMGQVLRKLVVYDDWSRLVVHVAMDNVLISSDVEQVATQTHGILPSSSSPEAVDGISDKCHGIEEAKKGWTRPLLLIIPLRLGLTAINACYLDAIVEFFKLPQCVGILGGRPNHAVYFYGAVGTKLLYLDPHVCQEFQDLDSGQSTSESPTDLLAHSTDVQDVLSAPADSLELQSVPGSDCSPNDGGRNSADQLLINSSSSPESNANVPTAVLLPSDGIGSPSNCSNGSSSNDSPSNCSNGSSSNDSPSNCSNGSNNSSFERHTNNGIDCCANGNGTMTTTTTTAATTTSSSMSKLSSAQSDECHCHSSISRCSTSEPEMPVDPVMDRFIDSFADAEPMFNGAGKMMVPMLGKMQELEQFDDGVDSSEGNEADEGRTDDGRGVEAVQLVEHECHGQSQGTSSDGGRRSAEECKNAISFDDSSFHCPYLLSMDFTSLDPSLALGFLLHNSDDYNDLVQRLRDSLLPKSSPPLFDVLDTRPEGWPSFSLEPSYLQDETLNIKEYDDLQYDSDEQFELLE